MKIYVCLQLTRIFCCFGRLDVNREDRSKWQLRSNWSHFNCHTFYSAVLRNRAAVSCHPPHCFLESVLLVAHIYSTWTPVHAMGDLVYARLHLKATKKIVHQRRHHGSLSKCDCTLFVQCYNHNLFSWVLCLDISPPLKAGIYTL